MRKMVQRIQVFLVGDGSAEVNGELVSIDPWHGMTSIVYRDGFETATRLIVPDDQIRMIRIWNEQEDE